MRHVYIHSLNQINEYLDDGQIKNCILLTTENEKVFHMKPEISNNLTNIENSTSLFCSLNHIHSTSYLHLVIDLAILSYQQIFDILCEYHGEYYFVFFVISEFYKENEIKINFSNTNILNTWVPVIQYNYFNSLKDDNYSIIEKAIFNVLPVIFFSTSSKHGDKIIRNYGDNLFKRYDIPPENILYCLDSSFTQYNRNLSKLLLSLISNKSNVLLTLKCSALFTIESLVVLSEIYNKDNILIDIIECNYSNMKLVDEEV
ncbi:TPA: hypothetical protein QCO17_004072 [Bacillus pacificus]|nr:hypothetical protein [Bacillus pacificus]HDR3634036.1 hypothetical protein [Bacillus pacificus]HDR7652972.1 hypothetical protein [Bacillus pacificus]